MREFTTGDIVQSVSDTANNVASPTVALPSGTVEGHGGIIVMGTQTQLESPEHWHFAARAGFTSAAALMGIMCRADLLEGETTWPFSVVGQTAAKWAWVVQEWTNVSFQPVAGSAATQQVTTPSSISTGTTGSWPSTDYVVGFAAVHILGGGSGWAASATWSNGFTETDVLSVGAGTAVDDMQLRVARKFGAAGDTGAWETTCDFGATQTGKSICACIAVFRAESLLGDI